MYAYPLVLWHSCGNYGKSTFQTGKSSINNKFPELYWIAGAHVHIYIYICIYTIKNIICMCIYIYHIYIYLYYIICYNIYIYIHGQSLSRIIFDLCGFSGAGLKITFGLRVMDSLTQFWCQRVGLSRLFCVILRHIFGPSKCDWQRAKSAIDRFLVAHDFSVQTKKCSFWMSRYILCIYI